MITLKFIFFLSCFIVFYNYIGYALIAVIINKAKSAFKKPVPGDSSFTPGVSFIVAAYNEEDCIDQKIRNSMELIYPTDKIEFIFITDGSTDGTNDIIRRYPGVQLMYSQDRNGKSAALNRAVDNASREILIFSDANTLLNKEAVKNIVAHYKNGIVGGVAGEKKIISPETDESETGAGEGFYWKYESFLKKTDSAFYSVVGAAGELFSVRKSLYQKIPHTVILDDFVLSMKVAQKGYRILYEPDAFAMELPSFSQKEEKKRKIRISAGGYQAIGMLGAALKFWKHPRLTYLYISHRLLRWTLSPLCLITAFLSNGLLALYSMSPVYKVLFFMQFLFYLAAFTPFYRLLPGKAGKILRIPGYFVFMNVSVIQGFFRFLRGKQPASWEKARRHPGEIKLQ